MIRKDIEKIMKQIDREIEVDEIKNTFLITALPTISVAAFFLKLLIFGY